MAKNDKAAERERLIRSILLVMAGMVLGLVLLKGCHVIMGVSNAPEAAASARRDQVLAEFQDWKAETTLVVGEQLAIEKKNLKELSRVVLHPDWGQPLGPQLEARKAIVLRVKQDLAAAYDGEDLSADKLTQRYTALLVGMDDPALRTALIGCIQPIVTISLQVRKAERFADLHQQAEAYKAEVRKQALEVIQGEIPFLG